VGLRLVNPQSKIKNPQCRNPPPQPSPGVPGEGEKKAHAIALSVDQAGCPAGWITGVPDDTSRSFGSCSIAASSARVIRSSTSDARVSSTG